MPKPWFAGLSRRKRETPLQAAITRLTDTLSRIVALDRPVVMIGESKERMHAKSLGAYPELRYRVDVVTEMCDDEESRDFAVVTTYYLIPGLGEVPKIVAVGRFDDDGVARFPDEDDSAFSFEDYMTLPKQLRTADISELDTLQRLLETGTPQS